MASTLSLPDTPVLPHLQSMLSLLREKWIHDFLFNPDPAHLTCLTAPLMTNNALTCSVSISRFSPVKPTAPQILDASFVFIPAFSVNSFSAGFGMQQNKFSSPSPLPFLSVLNDAAPEKEQFRYVRDDAAGTMFMLYDLPEQSYIRMEYLSHQSSTCRLRAFSNFDRAKFCHIRQQDPSLSPEALLQALTLFQVTYEYRNCPYCRRPPDAFCQCKLDLASARHNLDFQHGAKHMASHVGVFSGNATLKQFKNGIPFNVNILNSHMEVRGVTMPDLVHRLTKWALQQHAKDIPPPSPAASLLPPADDAQVMIGEDLDFLSFDSGPNARKQPSEELRAPENFAAPPIQFLKDVSPEFGASAFDRSEFASSLFNQGFGDMGFQDVSSMAKLFGWRMDSFGMQNVIPDSEQMLDINRFLDPDQGSPDVVESPRPKRMRASRNLQAGIENESATTLEKELNAEPVDNNSEQVKPAGSNAPALSPEELEAEKIKEWKRELKRERNRASARRSNAKKKQENDARKAEKQRLNNRVNELRAEEMRLRAENLRLRTELNSIGRVAQN